ncbi:hypothetical protein [Anaerospora sp.]|uniref:hypothetical protein n=1 Tax=Anaerospora sp. TaxID=1960278 RepID=UPI0028A038EC|nr:hypothetical protein [Anaerospora sp.]
MYTKIESQFWKDEKMLKLSGDARYLMLYLLTTLHRNMIGCYFLPEPYAYFDLGMAPEQFHKAMSELVRARRVKYDMENHILLIPNYLRFNPLENPNQVKSAIDKLDELPQTQLLQDLYDVVKTIDKQFMKPFTERLQERLPQPVNSNQDTVSSNSIQDSFVPDCAGTSEQGTDDTSDTEKKRTKYTYQSEHMRLAEQLKFRILEHKKNFKYPSSLDQWANTIRLMIEQDNRSVREIETVIDWCQKDVFWQSNILSADKLREKFDQLQGKMQSIQPSGKTDSSSRLSMIQNVKGRLASVGR